MDFMDLLTKSLEMSIKSSIMTRDEQIEDLATTFGKLLDDLEPGNTLRCRLAEEAAQREPNSAIQKRPTVDHNRKFQESDWEDHDFQFLLSEAASLGINVETIKDVVQIRGVLYKGIFHIGTDSRSKILGCITDVIREQRTNAAQKSKLKSAIQELYLNQTGCSCQGASDLGWKEDGDEIVIYNGLDWKEFNPLCQVFMILGGRVKHHLDDFRYFRLSILEQTSGDNATKISWTLPYSLRSLKKFYDIVNMMVIIHYTKASKLKESKIVELWDARMKKYAWTAEMDENDNKIRVVAGIANHQYNGQRTACHEIKILEMPCSMSDVAPFLELLWQVELGEVCTFNAENFTGGIIAIPDDTKIIYDAKIEHA